MRFEHTIFSKVFSLFTAGAILSLTVWVVVDVADSFHTIHSLWLWLFPFGSSLLLFLAVEYVFDSFRIVVLSGDTIQVFLGSRSIRSTSYQRLTCDTVPRGILSFFVTAGSRVFLIADGMYFTYISKNMSNFDEALRLVDESRK